MNCKIPFTKDIDFEKKLHEITSISLEHEIKVEEDTLKGNFIISGDYKSHEVSVNKEPFSYILPFEIDLAADIDQETIEFMIEDFTYEIIDNSILRVKIDFNVIAGTKEIPEEESIFRDTQDLFLEEASSEDILKTINIEEPAEIDDEKEDYDIPYENTELERDELIFEQTKSDDLAPNSTPEEERNNLELITEETSQTSEETIINSIKNKDDEYTTYHIHIVSDGESVETICTMYNSNINILGEYNNLENITNGDKLIIPESNE